MHAWGPLLIKKLDIAILIFLFLKFKDLPQIVDLFYLETDLAYNSKFSDMYKCGKAQGSINKYVKNRLMLGIFSNTIIITILQAK